VFVFDAAPGPGNRDTIRDFTPVDDTIVLQRSLFSRVGHKGELSQNAFWTGSKAHDRDDRIIYNKTSGMLSYDPDGTGAAKAVAFAVLTKKAQLSHADFHIV
jgi:Ca2+-binding RTX toxin-like protein